MGGGAGAARPVREAHSGPSPRGRGSRRGLRGGAVHAGSIPAWAGEPCHGFAGEGCHGVHPRVGGGALYKCGTVSGPVGPSPRGRGSHVRRGLDWAMSRSIPAWAGEPLGVVRTAGGLQVHPRVGGGAWMNPPYSLTGLGPSPRGRGSPLARHVLEAHPGSIPAWAGEPSGTCSSSWPSRVHPRVGGGATYVRATAKWAGGPSPRGRGSLVAHRPGAVLQRSIPAWAGEPLAIL